MGAGFFDHELNAAGEVIGGTIVLFDANVLGGDCEPIREDTIAHEIGHVLGLADSACSGYMMSSPSAPRSVQTAECNEADDSWDTTAENPGDPHDPPEEPPQCPTSPVLIDMDRNGFHLAGVADPVHFDIDGNGLTERVSWTAVDTGDAFLAFDRNRNGIVDDGSELFGTATRLWTGVLAENGYVALAEFDRRDAGGNADGKLSAEDLVWRDLQLWTDRNHDAQTQAGELLDISSSGVAGIDLDFQAARRRDRYGNEFRFRSNAVLRDSSHSGGRIATYDVFFVLAD